MIIPNICKVIKAMFQTTNQLVRTDFGGFFTISLVVSRLTPQKILGQPWQSWLNHHVSQLHLFKAIAGPGNVQLLEEPEELEDFCCFLLQLLLPVNQLCFSLIELPLHVCPFALLCLQHQHWGFR